MSSTLIRQVRVVDPVSQTDRIADVLVVAGWLRHLGTPELGAIAGTDSLETIEAEGWILAPGLVDLYSQSGEPGYESRETWHSLAQAAAAGGVTRIGILPTTDPVVDDPAQVAQILSQQQPHLPRMLPWGAITRSARGEQLTDLMELATAGIVGFSDGRPLSLELLQRLLEYAHPLQRPIALWPDDSADRKGRHPGVIREGAEALRLGLTSLSVMAETAPLAALLEYIDTLQTPVHIMRVSTARSVELLRQAKARGLPVTASVTWLHLVLNSRDLSSYDPNLRLAPPLGNPSDQQALIAGLEDGTLDAIAIDHRAYTYEEKTVGLSDAPAGAIGLELALPILWQTFVLTDRWQPLQLFRYLSSQPAQCLQLPAPALNIDHPAEMLLFNPQATWTVSSQTLKSRSANTSWLGQTLQGRVERLWIP
jgi:dihydroorotase